MNGFIWETTIVRKVSFVLQSIIFCDNPEKLPQYEPLTIKSFYSRFSYYQYIILRCPLQKNFTIIQNVLYIQTNQSRRTFLVRTTAYNTKKTPRFPGESSLLAYIFNRGHEAG